MGATIHDGPFRESPSKQGISYTGVPKTRPGEPATRADTMTHPLAKDLPIGDVLDELMAACDQYPAVVLQAPPGAGKTTLVPLALLQQSWLGEQKIVVLEPRRMAARAAAERMANLLGETVGETVGYRIRMDVCVSEHTRIEVITEGILSRQLQSDPGLEGIGIVLFDEFHERSLESDLALALTLQARDSFRDEDKPLRLLVMSATLDGAAVADLLEGAPVVTSAGRQYPVAVSHRPGLKLSESIVDPVARQVITALGEEDGNILVFLPGQSEIARVSERLRCLLPPEEKGLIIAPLFGGLSLVDQRRAVAAPPDGRRKVVLATNIAETSLTIEGVTVVVDSGLARVPLFDVARGTTRLATHRISRASAEQRTGRAGRLAPGRCYRLWSEDQHRHLVEHSPPEIRQSDLSGLALQVLAWGASGPDEFQWMDAPASSAWAQALATLRRCGALFDNAMGRPQLTPHGVRMAQMPMPPRLAHMLLLACDLDARDTGAFLAALLAERNPVSGGGVDLSYAIAMLEGRMQVPRELRDWCARTRGQATRFSSLCNRVYHPRKFSLRVAPEDLLGILVANAYPERIARLRNAATATYQLANGRSAVLPQDDALAGAQWIAVAELGGRSGGAAGREDVVYSAVPLDHNAFRDVLAPLVEQVNYVDWDDSQDRFVAERRRVVGELVLDAVPLEEVPQDDRNRALVRLLRHRGLNVLPWSRPLRQWRARVELLARLEREQAGSNGAMQSRWPDLSDDALLATLEDWLLPFLGPVSRISDFTRLDLRAILQAQLPWPLPLELERQAPERLAVPTGSSIAIDYLQDLPVLAVKLQEMFGCEETPRIADGRVAVVLHLLSPAGRPLQVTQDLGSFWRGAYADVRREMKGRYPKHPWPEDPLSARATRFTRRRGQ